MLVNSSKQKSYVRFDWIVNQDVTIRHLRYYPFQDFVVLPGRKGFGRNWIHDVVLSDYLKKEILRICRERWPVDARPEQAAPRECTCGMRSCGRGCGAKRELLEAKNRESLKGGEQGPQQ